MGRHIGAMARGRETATRSTWTGKTTISTKLFFLSASRVKTYSERHSRHTVPWQGHAKLQRMLRGKFRLACAGVYHIACADKKKKRFSKTFFFLSARAIEHTRHTAKTVTAKTVQASSGFISQICSTREADKEQKKSRETFFFVRVRPTPYVVIASIKQIQALYLDSACFFARHGIPAQQAHSDRGGPGA